MLLRLETGIETSLGLWEPQDNEGSPFFWMNPFYVVKHDQHVMRLPANWYPIELSKNGHS
jgi:hypothetical protein